MPYQLTLNLVQNPLVPPAQLDFLMDKTINKITMSLGSNTYKEHDFDLTTIGGRLKWLLKERGMNQADLARAIGVSENAISSIILGDSKQPSALNTLKICAYLEAEYEWLLTGKGEIWRQPAPPTDQGADELRELFLTLPEAARDVILTTAKAFSVQAREAREGNETDKKAKP